MEIDVQSSGEGEVHKRSAEGGGGGREGLRDRSCSTLVFQLIISLLSKLPRESALTETHHVHAFFPDCHNHDNGCQPCERLPSLLTPKLPRFALGPRASCDLHQGEKTSS
eukprot:756711-Hanusia_phi.AAC.3